MYIAYQPPGGRSYLQIVESFRTDTGAVRQRVIANLGRLDQLGTEEARSAHRRPERAPGRSTNSAESVEYDSACAFGDVYALHELWQSLGFGPAIKRAALLTPRNFDAEALVRAMVFNRLCAPDSKLGCLQWLETVAMPAAPESVCFDQLLRTMDALMERAGRSRAHCRAAAPDARPATVGGVLRPHHGAHPRRRATAR